MDLSEKRFFCLRGFMKSGTNWVGKLLNLHPQIDCVGEFHWERYLHLIRDGVIAHAFVDRQETDSILRDEMHGLIRRCMVRLADPAASVIGDRTPHSIEPETLPDDPVICVIRDGRDVLISRLHHLFNRPEVTADFDCHEDMAGELARFQKNPNHFLENPDRLLSNEQVVRTSMRMWATHMEQDRKSMQQGDRRDVLVIRYEDLHADVESKRSELYCFLGADPAEADPLEPALRAGFRQERPNKFFRKGQVGDWKNYMTDQARRWVNEEAGQELLRQGYIDSLDW